jgi:DNA polymerase III subunit delta
MTEKKAHEVDGWLGRPDPRMAIVLIYGPDRGLVAERARLFVSKSGISADDPFSLVRIDASDIERDPGRLIDEAGTVSMFSARRLIWVRDAGTHKGFADAVKALASSPLADATVLIEAGELKKGAALRTAVESAPLAVALPCYSDDGKSIDVVIDDAMQKAGVSLGLEARQALKRNLGGDRLASRSEIEKLILYAQGSTTIGVDDVLAATGDASSTTADAVIDAAILGRIGELDAAFSRFVSSGNQLFPLLNAALRQFHSLDGLRAAMDNTGRSAAAVVASARPPVFYARKATVEAALVRWPRPTIAQALDRLQAAVLKSRQRAELAEPIVRQALLGLAVESMRLTRG